MALITTHAPLTVPVAFAAAAAAVVAVSAVVAALAARRSQGLRGDA